MDVREKLIEQAISHFSYGVSHDIFSEPVTTYAKLAIEALEKEKEIGVTVQEWIPVTERLPDWRDGKVLVFTKYGFSICERTVNNRWRGQHANWITHWAYLPKPPKGE